MCHVTEVLVNRRYLKMPTVSVYWVRGHNKNVTVFICSLSVKYLFVFLVI